MATPIVAGSLSLIRQYFTDGWYPSGAPQAASAFLPSAPLLKAVLLGAERLRGVWVRDCGALIAVMLTSCQAFNCCSKRHTTRRTAKCCTLCRATSRDTGPKWT